jgi:hypothetical protein
MRFKHRVERVLWGLDEVAELPAKFALSRWIPYVMAILDENLGMLQAS